MLKKILVEPLLHFILISILFFVGYDMLNPDESGNPVIVVSEGRIAQISNSFIARWNREPSPIELENAINGFVLNEMYQREARALNLDEGDKVIGQRLRKKMTYLLEDLASNDEPSVEELKKFYNDNSADYLMSSQFSFKQVFVSTDRSEEELNQLLALQTKRIEQDLSPEGDSSLLPSEVALTPRELLARNFGDLFLSELETIEPGSWQGPIQSGFGLHFVFIQSKKAEKVKPFNAVKDTVLHDWRYQNNKEYQENYEKRLLERYTVKIQTPKSSKEG